MAPAEPIDPPEPRNLPVTQIPYGIGTLKFRDVERETHRVIANPLSMRASAFVDLIRATQAYPEYLWTVSETALKYGLVFEHRTNSSYDLVVFNHDERCTLWGRVIGEQDYIAADPVTAVQNLTARLTGDRRDARGIEEPAQMISEMVQIVVGTPVPTAVARLPHDGVTAEVSAQPARPQERPD